MMNLRIAFSLLSAGLVAWPAASLAHHARFVYDSSELVEIQGAVESIFWRNPHIRFGVRTSDEAGGGVVWEMEGGPINALERAGIEAGAIAAGATVPVLGFVSRRDDNTMQPVHLAYADGRNVVLSQEWALHFGLLDEPMRAALDPGPGRARNPRSQRAFSGLGQHRPHPDAGAAAAAPASPGRKGQLGPAHRRRGATLRSGRHARGGGQPVSH